MAIGKEIEKRGHITGFREEISKTADSSEDEFFTWFDSAKDKGTAFVRGSWDFMLHIAQPSSQFLSEPENKIALEIGHGGGRILAAASRCFGKVIGVDIHENNSKVERELENRGIDNFQLIETDGTTIPLADSSLDFVYSFIVLQHVERYEVFKKYLQEAHRVLKSNGIAVLYFGRRCKLSANQGSMLLYVIDRLAERVLLPRGFRELPAKVNGTNLIVSLSHAKHLPRGIGFEVLKELVSHKKVPDGVKLYGGQNGFVLRRK